MTLPNIISLARLLSVPVIVWVLLSGFYLPAFWLFIGASISDGVDGFIAKRFNSVSVLGTYLDPIADKMLLVSIYITLGQMEVLPLWLVILVVSRDILIVGAVMLSFAMDQPVQMAPLMVSLASGLIPGLPTWRKLVWSLSSRSVRFCLGARIWSGGSNLWAW